MAAIFAQMISGGVELLNLVWMEITMIAVAVCGYVLFHGLPLSSTGGKKMVKTIAEESPSEEEQVSQDIQKSLSEGHHRAVYKLWQRIKSLDMPSCSFPLFGVVDSMEKLGKNTEAILGEFRSALECNESLFTSDTTQALLESLKKCDNHAELLTGLTKLFEASGLRGASPARSQKSSLASLEGALKGGRLDEAMNHLNRLPGKKEKAQFTPPVELVTKLISLAGRQHRLLEVTPKLIQFQLQLEPRMLNEVLTEANRRRDSLFCREVYRFGTEAKVAKNAQTYELLVNGLALDSTIVPALFEEVLADPDVQVTESLAIALLNACASSRDAKLAARVFQAVSPTYGAPDHVLYTALLRAYCTCELHDEVCDIYEKEMAPQSIKPDAQLGDIIMRSAMQCGRNKLAQSVFAGASGDINKHLTMIKACSRENNLQGALDVFERLKASGASLNSMTFNSILDACIQCKDHAKALELFKQMRSEGIIDVVSFNIMLKIYLRSGQHAQAEQLLQEMKECGLQANKITYNELINARVEAGDHRGVWQIVKQMKSEGVSPNSITCSILLKALTAKSSKQDLKFTMDLVDQMEDKMDEILFASVIEACLRVGQLDLLSEQMRKYAKQGGLVALTAPTYGSMIKAYGQAHDVERMWELWTEMEKRNVKPTAITLGCMVDALVKNRCVEDAWDLIHTTLSDPSRRSLVNNIIYSTVLKGFAMTKQNEKLFAVYAEIQDQGVTANTVMYNTMIDACARCGAMDRVPQLLTDMKAANVKPDTITYSTLVKGHCLSGNVDCAFEVLAQMLKEGLKPDEILYNCLLDGCAKEHRLEEALKLYEDMKKDYVSPSNFTLCTLVKLLGRSRRLPQAFAMVEDLSTNSGLKPNIQVYTCLIQACIHNRQLQRALELHDEVIAANCEPDQKTYTVIARGCVQSGNLVKAVEIVRCAYCIGGHSFKQPSKSYGVEARVLEELIMKLNQGSPTEAEVGRSLLADLKQQRGLNMQDNVYSQVVREAARGGDKQWGQRPRAQQRGW
jgi:pentatricopeptide repeat protein